MPSLGSKQRARRREEKLQSRTAEEVARDNAEAARKQGVAVTSGAAAASAMRGTVARRGICAGCAAHAARIGDASTGRRIATGEKAAAAATADSSTMVRIVYPRLREHRRFGVSAGGEIPRIMPASS